MITYTLVRLFKEKSHAEQFVQGKIYMSPLLRFRNYFDVGGEQRGDPYEGLVAWYQPDGRTLLQVADHRIPGSDLIAPVALQLDWVTNLNALCFYSINSSKWDTIPEEKVQRFGETLKIHRKSFGLGDWAVVALNAEKLLARIHQVLDSRSLPCRARYVHYFDEGTHQGTFPENLHGFIKRARFSHQNEYRIVVSTGSDQAVPYVLDVGDLSDITALMTTETFNETLEIRFAD